MGRAWIATGLALTASLGLVGCGKKAVQPAAADNASVVEIARVSLPTGEAAFVATGALKRVRESNLSFRIPGVITRLTVDEGDIVKAGQVIATVDPTAVDARLRQAAGDLERAKRDLARAEPLVERGAFSRQQVDDARTAAANAKAAYDAAARPPLGDAHLACLRRGSLPYGAERGGGRGGAGRGAGRRHEQPAGPARARAGRGRRPPAGG